MELTQLLPRIEILEVKGPASCRISGLAYDSRRVEQGMAFFALPGVVADGFDFIPQALERGAAAVICERIPEVSPADVCFVRVSNARQAMARLAAAFYGDPTAGIPVIGVTGTNGKTTTTYLLEAILRQAGYSPAVFGTIEYRFGASCVQAERTTPEAIDLSRMLAEFRAAGADALIMEVASHALEQHRVDGIHFDVAVFTNLTPDHLDYHLDMESYFSSKRRLFAELLGSAKGVINSDDPYGCRLLAENGDWMSFGLNADANARPVEFEIGRDGIRGSFACGDSRIAVTSGLIGSYNVSNLLAAASAAYQLGIAAEVIATGIASAPQVPGRLERVANDSGVLALVDYAHTGDALEQVLKTVSHLEHRRLYSVVGCGGDRDKSKRPVMGGVAVRYSDLAILTSDNPRTEDPLAILAQIREGALAAGSTELNEDQAGYAKGFIVILDRRSAIEFAGRIAQSDDLILVAGKGHEDYQILGTTKIHFDDREELDRVLNPPGNGADDV